MITDLLIHIFVRNADKVKRPKVRLMYGLLAGYTGIVVNAMLFVLKFVIGLLSGSVAIAADAANNLADAGSSVVTIIGFRLAAQPADKDHPFGHGRGEYVAGVVVSVIVIVVGFNFFRDSIFNLFARHKISIGLVPLILFGSSILFKFWLFLFYRKIGRRISSDVIKAAALDSLSDMLSTSVVLGSAIAGKFTTLPVDAMTGTLVALLVIAGGIKLLRSTTNSLMGERPAQEMVDELRSCLLQCAGIKGVHDIIIHNYGPNQYFATAHAEVEPGGTLFYAHDMLEAAEIHVAKRMPVRLVLHCDPFSNEPEVLKWRGKMEEIISLRDCQFKLYDFRLKIADTGNLQLCFHLLTPRNYPLSHQELHRELTREIQKSAPDAELIIEFINSYI